MRYINITLGFFVLLFLGCKQEKHFKDNIGLKSDTALKKENTLDKIQNIKEFEGFWESYSYYLEHEEEFKDFNQNKFYKIIYDKKALDIKLIDHKINEALIETYYYGFVQKEKEQIEFSEDFFSKDLKNSGNLLVRYNKNLKDFDASQVQTSSSFSRYFDVTEVLEDGFEYEKKPNDFVFKILETLPEEIFKVLKEKSKNDKVDYIKEFHVSEQSKKIKVISEKTFFYNEMSDDSKRKAFLVKGDVAYLEDIENNWAKVYYDGKIVSGGFVKRSDLEVLE